MDWRERAEAREQGLLTNASPDAACTDNRDGKSFNLHASEFDHQLFEISDRNVSKIGAARHLYGL